MNQLLELLFIVDNICEKAAQQIVHIVVHWISFHRHNTEVAFLVFWESYVVHKLSSTVHGLWSVSIVVVVHCSQ